MYRKFIPHIILSAVFCLAGFGGGYFIGANSAPTEAVEETANNTHITENSHNTAEIPENSQKENNSEDKYLLKNEGGKLNLYHISNDAATIIKSIEFGTSFLPPEDLIKLEKGIYFDTIEEGFSLIEDFTS